MARFPYTKLNAKINQEIKTIEVEGAETVIEVRQYLPVDEKLGLIGRVIELAHDDNNFANPLKLRVYFALEVIDCYTKIAFTEKQKENVVKLYDSLYSSGWVDTIFETIPEKELGELEAALYESVDAFYSYRTSILGVMENINTDYSNLNFDITDLQEKLSNGENIELVKKIMENLG